MHNGFVRVDNEKMSKSLGTSPFAMCFADTTQKLCAFSLCGPTDRSALNYSDAHLDDARQALKAPVHSAQSVQATDISIDWSNPFAARFKAAMDEEFAAPLRRWLCRLQGLQER